MCRQKSFFRRSLRRAFRHFIDHEVLGRIIDAAARG
jgi:hypothetical protein